MSNKLIIMVTGGRDYKDATVVAEALAPYGRVGNILVQGGATGADWLARRYWHKEAELPYVTHPAPWNRVGRPAGLMRNTTMVRGQSLAPFAKLVPDVLVAFPGSKGTAHAIREAEEAGIEVVRVV